MSEIFLAIVFRFSDFVVVRSLIENQKNGLNNGNRLGVAVGPGFASRA